MENTSSTNAGPRTGLILIYFSAYILSATIFQVRSDTPPWLDGSPLESFTGALLWISSLISLLMADALRTERGRFWLWLAASACLALLALDEIFSFHERTKDLVGDDDHIKVLQWLLAGGVLHLIDRVEHPPARARIAFTSGYIIHGLYVLSDVGDGDYFHMPFVSIAQLRWTEEYLELFALSAYCAAFIFLYTKTLVHQSNR